MNGGQRSRNSFLPDFSTHNAARLTFTAFNTIARCPPRRTGRGRSGQHNMYSRKAREKMGCACRGGGVRGAPCVVRRRKDLLARMRIHRIRSRRAASHARAPGIRPLRVQGGARLLCHSGDPSSAVFDVGEGRDSKFAIVQEVCGGRGLKFAMVQVAGETEAGDFWCLRPSAQG